MRIDCSFLRSKLDEVALAVTEAQIPYDFGPWLEMSEEGLEFIKVRCVFCVCVLCLCVSKVRGLDLCVVCHSASV